MSMITSRNTRSLNAINTADFIVIRRGPGGISIEAHEREDDWSSVTVGPFDLDELRATLDRLAATPSLLGSYSRTDAPDPLDGGVTAAAIEKETEGPGGPLDETADFWRARWKEAADRADARDLAAHQWKEATRENIARFRAARDFAEMCQKGSRAATVRAERAERERDEAREAWKGALESVKEAIAVINSLRAEQPRPLSPDAITNEQQDRARDAVLALLAEQEPRPLFARVKAGKVARAAIRAALTEPPARPEGAEELEAVIGLNAGAWTNGADDVRALADLLASEGVRVTGADR